MDWYRRRGHQCPPQRRQRFSSFERNSADQHSLTINDIWSLFQDKSGLIWVGTAGGGINVTMSFENQLSRIMHAPSQADGLSHEFVWDIEEDKQGMIWFATLNGLDKYNPQNDSFVHFTEFYDHNGKSVGNRIQAFTFDEFGRVWFGNQQGQLAVYDFEKNTTKVIQRQDFQRDYVSTNRIRMVEGDRFGNIWVGTDDGLLKISAATQSIIADYNFMEQGVLGDTLARTMLQDADGIIWFGTWNSGLQRYDPEFDTVQSFENIPGDQNSISDNTVRSLFKDSQGNLWVGTFNGLNLLTAEEIQKGSFGFQSFLEKDGLPNSAIYGIVGASDGKLWLSTNKGLSEFSPEEKVFKNFTIEDGLTTNEFNGNAAIRSVTDDIYFGSVNGVTVVNPVTRTRTNFQPQIRLTNLSVQGDAFLPKGVTYTQQEVDLDYTENDVSFEFASLDFRHPNRNRFRYRLLPYTNEWTDATFNNQAVFTNLDPNQYTFELQATNSDGNWVEQTLKVPFKIHPPLWRTWWAYFIYFAAAMGLVIYFINKQEKSLQEQKAINEHLRRVDQLKDEFLANTSHELRTPLNGIIGIAESLKEGVAGLQNEKTLNHLQLIIDGGKRLSQLVNDILDFKKLSHHNLVLQRKAADLSSIVNVVISLLKPLAEEKSLQLINNISEQLPLVYADENRLQQVLHNLIGNAIKYTKQGSVEITAIAKNNFVEVCVIDTGIGIDPSQLKIIFEPFEQAELAETISHRGTGLGLSVSHQLIEEHGGSLWAESQLGNGSRFYFEIPMWLENVHEIESPTQIVTESKTGATPKLKSKTKANEIDKRVELRKGANKGRVLIADDDPINLQVLSDLLHINGYEVESAQDGLAAVELGESQKFDLAILDIMMPGLSGYEVCKKLREKYTAIELPILLLSARNQPGDISAGFE
ncbi:MAG: ATP-binding protein, partial [Kangiellaceae bacterium]|nr:ATP-binding protein [Kangiellaceae bacterium]